MEPLLDRLDKYMNLFEFKWLRAEREKNIENMKLSAYGSNNAKPGKSCAEIKESYP
jgi:hypothetical protein